MIRQYLSHTNKSATVLISLKILKLNNAKDEVNAGIKLGMGGCNSAVAEHPIAQ